MELPDGTPKVEKVKGSNRQTFSARRKTWSTHFVTFQNLENFSSNDPNSYWFKKKSVDVVFKNIATFFYFVKR